MDAYTASADAVALAAATAKTVLLVKAPAAARMLVKEIEVSFDGVSATAVPALVEIVVQQTTDGTTTGVTAQPHDANAPAAPITAGKTATVEPSGGVVLKALRLSPYGGLVVLRFDADEVIRVPAAGRLAVRCTAAAVVNVNAYITVLA
jgi:hypothetical protein